MVHTCRVLCGTGRVPAVKGKGCLTYSFIGMIVCNFTVLEFHENF